MKYGELNSVYLAHETRVMGIQICCGFSTKRRNGYLSMDLQQTRARDAKKKEQVLASWRRC